MSGGGGSGGGSSTTVQKADPWVGVQPYLADAYNRLSNMYTNAPSPQYYPGSTVASPNGWEGMGNQSQLNNSGYMQALANSATNGVQAQGGLALQGANGGLGTYQSGVQGMQNLAGRTSDVGNSLLAGGANNLGQSMGALNAYGNNGVIQSGTSSLGQSIQSLMSAGNLNNNPAYQDALNASIRPLTENYQRAVLPSLKSGAQDAGQFGGSRQGIAEGLAAQGYMNSVGDVSANMGNAAYAQGLQATQAAGQMGGQLANMGLGALSTSGQLGSTAASQGLSALGQSGQLQTGIAGLGGSLYGAGLTGLGQSAALANGAQQAQAYPGSIMQGIGQQYTSDAQAQLDSEVNRWNYNQNLPYTMLSDYLQQLQGGAGLGTTSSSSQSGGSRSRVTGALGGAATGAAIGSVVPGIGTAIGAGIGGLYGLFA